MLVEFGKVVDRLLLQYQEPQPRFKRLKAWFEDPMTEVYLKFHQSVIPTFTRFNLTLQREEPSIFLLEEEMTNFLKSSVVNSSRLMN